jgi:methionine-gamma-lyase
MAKKEFPFTGFTSLAIHAGHEQDPQYAHLTPIYASSTFVYDNAEQGMRRFSKQEEGYIYTRWGNPTFTEAEKKIAAMECFGVTDAAGKPLVAKALLHASGMAAISTLFISNLKAGDQILSHYSLYGGSQEMMDKILPGLGIEAVIVDLRDLNKAEDALKSHPNIKLCISKHRPTQHCNA